MNSYELYKQRLDSKKSKDKSNFVETNNNEVSSKDLSWWEQFGAGAKRIKDNLIQGVLDLGEGLVDTGAGALAFGAKVFGNPVAEKEIEKFIKTDYTQRLVNNEIFGNITGDFLLSGDAKKLAQSDEKFLPEIFGVELDDIAMGVGNALGTGALNLIPGGQVLTFGAFTGTGVEGALQEGATIDEAMAYGALSGTTEMIIESVMDKVLGGLGLGLNKAFGVGTSKALTKGGASAVKNIFKGMTEEGLEEVVSELANPIWQMITYKNETEGNFFEKYGKIFEENGGAEAVISSFIAGGLTGGLFEGVSTAKGIGRYGSLENYNLELETQQLYAINRNLEDALAEGNEKKYQKYQAKKLQIIDRATTKFENLLNTLKKESETVNENTSQKQLNRIINKEKLASDFAEQSESKAEVELAKKILGKNVDVELTKGKDSETNVQKAIVKLASGQTSVKEYIKTILHEGGHLVQSSQKGFVESILNGMDEKTYNDLWAWAENSYKNEIMNSNMFKVAKQKNPNQRDEEIYNSIKKEYLDEEIAVEYFGSIFKNSKEFMNDIKAYNSKGLKALKEKFRLFFRGKSKPNNYKEIMQMFDKGVEEADKRAIKRKEEEAKQEREKRIKEIENALPDDDEDVRHRIVETDVDGVKTIEIEDKLGIFKNEDGSYMSPYEIRKKILSIVKEHIGSYYNADVGVDLTITTTTANEMGYADESTKIRNLSKRELARKANTILNIEQLINQSVLVGEKTKTGVKLPAYVFKINILLNSNKIPVYLLVQPKDTKLLLYDLFLKNYSYKSLNENEKAERKGVIKSKMTIGIRAVSSTESIARDTDDVKGDVRKRITKDSEGNKLSPKQQEYFNDSVVRDDNGNLLVVYHGSKNEFTIFDRSKAGESNKMARLGFWFTTSEKGAKTFAESVWYGENDEPLAYKGYLNIKKPKIYEETKFEEEYKDSLKKEQREIEKQLNGSNHNNALYSLAEKHQYPVWDIWKILGKIEKIDGLDNRLEALQETDLPNEIKEFESENFKAQARLKELDDLIAETYYNDAYENFRTDFYKFLGANAEDANIGGTGKALWKNDKLVDFNEAIENYRKHLIEQGYDGIIIKDTKYDSGTLGRKNTQYMIFNSNQFKNQDNVNPTEDEDIRKRITDNNGLLDEALLNDSNRKSTNKRDSKALSVANKTFKSKKPLAYTKIYNDKQLFINTEANMLFLFADEDRLPIKTLPEDMNYPSIEKIIDTYNYYDYEGKPEIPYSVKVKDLLTAVKNAKENKSYVIFKYGNDNIVFDYETLQEFLTLLNVKPKETITFALKNDSRFNFKPLMTQRDNGTFALVLPMKLDEDIDEISAQELEMSSIVERIEEDKVKTFTKPYEEEIDLDDIENDIEAEPIQETEQSTTTQEESVEQSETTEEPIEEVVEETPKIDENKIKEIHKKYDNPFRKLKQKLNSSNLEEAKTLKPLYSKLNSIDEAITSVNDNVIEYRKELIDNGVSIEEATKIVKEWKHKELYGVVEKIVTDKGVKEKIMRGMGFYKGLKAWKAEIEKKIKEIEERTKQETINEETTVVAEKEIDEQEIINSLNAIVGEIELEEEKTKTRGGVRKQPTPSAQTINLFGDFNVNPEARVFAQERGNELLKYVLNNIQNVWGLKKLSPRLYYPKGKEFVLTRIHAILNKFSNAQYTKQGEDFYDYSNLTKEEQIDLITEQVLSGIQVYTTGYNVEGDNAVVNEEPTYQYVSEGVLSEPAYNSLVSFVKKQIDVVMDKGRIPKVQEIIAEATKEINSELSKTKEIISKQGLRIRAYIDSINKLSNEIDNYKETIRAYEREGKKDAKEIAKLKKTIDTLNERLATLNERLNTQAKYIADSDKNLKKVVKSNQQRIKDLEKDALKLITTIEKLQEKYDIEVRKNKELKELADNTASKVKALKNLENKYSNQLIVKLSQLERGRALPPQMNEILQEVGRLINPEFKINSKLSIEIAKLLIKNEKHDAFNLMINAVLDSEFEVEDGFVDYHELVDMFNVDENNAYLESLSEMETWFNEFVATGKLTKVEKLYRKIERITDAYFEIKAKYLNKKAELAVYRASKQTALTTARITKLFKKLKSGKKFGGVDKQAFEWLEYTYEKINELKVREIQNGGYRNIVNDILIEYDNIKKTLPKEYKIEEALLDEARTIVGDKINAKNINAYKRFLNTISRYAKEITGQATFTIDGETKTKREWASEIYDSLNETVGSGKVKLNRALLYTVDPRVVFKLMGGMDENNVVYKLYKMLNQGEIKYQEVILKLGGDIREFYSKHKKIEKALASKKKVTIGGYEATRGQFLSLYKLMQREQARKHMLNLAGGIKLGDKIYREFTEESLEELENEIKKFFDLDNENSEYKQYIDLTTKFFEKAKEYKVDTDIELMGYTNVEDGEYFPIRVMDADLQHNLEQHNYQYKNIMGVLDMSFNKEAVSSLHALEINNIDDIMQNHMKQMAIYSSYAMPIHTFNKIFNYRFPIKEKGDLNSVGGILAHTTFAKYMNDLFMDIQGMKRETRWDDNFVNRIFGWTRSKFAQIQLGANLKVIFSQVSALGNALKYVKLKYMTKALTSKINIKSGAYEIPTIAKYRNLTHTISSSQMLAEAKNSFWTKGIEWADQKCIEAIWKACLLQNGMDVAKATEMFNKTVQETQPNYTPLQRSAMLRSQNEIIKSFTMFGNQPNKNFSNVMEAILTISYKKKNGLEITKSEWNYMRKSIIESVLWSSAIYSIISVFFSHLTNGDWDDEPEEMSMELAERFINDAFVGVIPFINNLIDVDFDGGIFGLNWNEIDTGNTTGMYNDLLNLMNGKQSTKEMVDTIAAIFGIPTANAYKYLMGVVQYIAPEFTTQVELEYKGIDITTTQAVKNTKSHKTRDYYMAYTTNTGHLSQKTMNELYRLYKKDEGVILKAIPSVITYNGEEIRVTRTEFKKYYNALSETLEEIVNDYAYIKLSDEEKALVIKNAINKYHNMSKKQFTKADMNSLEYLMSVGYKKISKDLIYLGQIRKFESKQEVQKYVNKLPLKATQKYLIFYLSGYSIPEDKEKMVINYLTSNGVQSKYAKDFFEI